MSLDVSLTGAAKIAAIDTLREAIHAMTGYTPGYAETEDALDRAIAAAAVAASRQSGAVAGPDGGGV